jgi:hypothetical protein
MSQLSSNVSQDRGFNRCDSIRVGLNEDAKCFVGDGIDREQYAVSTAAFIAIYDDVMTVEYMVRTIFDGVLRTQGKIEYARKNVPDGSELVQKVIQNYLTGSAAIPLDRSVLMKLVLQTFVNSPGK